MIRNKKEVSWPGWLASLGFPFFIWEGWSPGPVLFILRLLSKIRGNKIRWNHLISQGAVPGCSPLIDNHRSSYHSFTWDVLLSGHVLQPLPPKLFFFWRKRSWGRVAPGCEYRRVCQKYLCANFSLWWQLSFHDRWLCYRSDLANLVSTLLASMLDRFLGNHTCALD